MNFCDLKNKRREIPVFIFIYLMFVSVATLSPAIDSYRERSFLGRGLPERDIINNVLGEARKIFAVSCYVNADLYLHGGVYDIDKSECGQSYTLTGAQQGDEHHEERADHDHGRKEHRSTAHNAFPIWNILPYIGEAIDIGEHIHLQGEEEKEILPWFVFATRLDPNNAENYQLGGWFAWRRLGRIEEGEEFLRKGLAHNPDSWKIYKELGFLYFMGRGDFQEALVYLHKAVELISEDNSDKYEMRQVYAFTAHCYEMIGNNEKALEYYKEILALFPRDESVQNKVRSLSASIGITGPAPSINWAGDQKDL
ncbi:MAG: tetratricopeptide repeat protein [Candidatus Omnitrophota bacterium]